jgi:hypothetical protein
VLKNFSAPLAGKNPQPYVGAKRTFREGKQAIYEPFGRPLRLPPSSIISTS